MRARKPASILNAGDYGFRSSAAVEKLGRTVVRVKIYLLLYPPVGTLAPLTPAQRGRALVKYYRSLYERLRPLLPAGCKPDREFRCCTADLPAASLRTVRRHPSVYNLWLLRCPGRRVRPRPRPQKRDWFAVLARFAIQVEGERRGRQDYEDRIVLVRATSFGDAARRLERPFKRYGKPYLGATNRLVRWRFEEVLDVYSIGDINLRASAIEVYSRIRSRPLLRRNAWIPRKPGSP